MLESIYRAVEIYIFVYPMCMSILWCIGSLYFYFRRELYAATVDPYAEPFDMGISVIIPAHNEAENISETVSSVMATRYPIYEIIIVDDASTDNTWDIICDLSRRHDKIRCIRLLHNKGKAMALNVATAASRYDILLVIDADALIEPDTMAYMARHYIHGPRVGAVTGNPRVRNRNTLLEKIQVAEYSSIIGIIKRTQRILGKIFTVSGAIVSFRKSAVLDVGLWDVDMITDDINISWKLEKRFWDLRYETQALCWTVVPNSFLGLWRQRVRWAQGGCEVLVKHMDIWKDIRHRRFWPVYIEYLASGIWANVFVVFTAVALVSIFVPINGVEFNWISGWIGFIITMMCLTQFSLAFMMDSLYEKGMLKYVFYIVWYAVVYWLLTAGAIFVAGFNVIFCKRKKNHVAVWTSPDRNGA